MELRLNLNFLVLLVTAIAPCLGTPRMSDSPLTAVDTTTPSESEVSLETRFVSEMGCVSEVEAVTRWSSKVVCRCLRVTENEICEAIVLGDVQSVKDLGRCTGAGQGCNACHPALRKYLAERNA